jgi:hypothetical protein
LRRRLRVVALIAIVAATALMWSDTAIEWWSDFVSFALRVNQDATTSVMNSRPSGDADLHAVVWGTSAAILAVSCSGFRARIFSLAALASWTIAVEIAQPWFTELRSRQLTDLVGNVVGVGFIAAVVLVQQVRFFRPTE